MRSLLRRVSAPARARASCGRCCRATPRAWRRRNLRGRAIAIAMVGVSVAMSIGVPAGTFLSKAIGWHATFGALSAFALGLIAWIIFGVPDFPGLAAGKRTSVRQALGNPGVRVVLMITFTFVLAHNILYTYIAPFVARRDWVSASTLCSSSSASPRSRASGSPGFWSTAGCGRSSWRAASSSRALRWRSG